MTQVDQYVRSLERSRASLLRRDRPKTFAMAGREWDLLGGVFAPPFSPSTGVAMELLGLTDADRAPWRGSFLEVGCGTGVIAVSAALAGCDRVTALDISEQAVRNTRMNAERHGVADRVKVVHSDLFDGLAAGGTGEGAAGGTGGGTGDDVGGGTGDDVGGERFDTVYWHSNFVLAPSAYRYETMHERAYVDPGYRAHRRFLAEAPSYLADGGRILLHFSDRGDLASLHAIADECGRELRALRGRTDREGEDTVEHTLFEIAVAAPTRRDAAKTPGPAA
ncbi:class I SAM-dependent methyltransferase [Streptomyces sp. NK15101]|uniref:50S ribosomal protein L11 methyltransferase n=1 Tax=Streptomyces sp. NK15101 TaxID=2873261 RepID=UPI001CEC8399|nr:class I SAM-dependent methyltransferase [Streptomyces sp. NK15101]